MGRGGLLTFSVDKNSGGERGEEIIQEKPSDDTVHVY